MDPREALIRRLLEYQKYKHAGEQLAARGVAGRDVFPRGMPARGGRRAPGLPPLAEVPLFALVEAFQRVLDRSKVKLSHDIVADRISLSDRIARARPTCSRTRRRLAFEELFEGLATKFDLVITFLALLEMTSFEMTRLFQSEPLGPLYVELAAGDSRGGRRPRTRSETTHVTRKKRTAETARRRSRRSRPHGAGRPTPALDRERRPPTTRPRTSLRTIADDVEPRRGDELRVPRRRRRRRATARRRASSRRAS